MIRTPMKPADLPNTAVFCRETLARWLDRDWSVQAGVLEWDCRKTLDHVINVQIFLGGNAAMRSTSRVLPARNGDPAAEHARRDGDDGDDAGTNLCGNGSR